MDINTAIQFINGCGFPIVACAALGWFVVWNRKQNDANRQYNYENLKTAIDNQTTAVNTLCDVLREVIKK